jgi:ABC-type branched-subunit amino acid transport system substrate-binding protein
MIRRAFVLLLGTLALAGCGGGYSGGYPGGYYGNPYSNGSPMALVPNAGPSQGAAAAPTAGPASGSDKVAILLPLSGPRADIGQPMLQAAQLALDAPGAPALIVKDTGGTPEGAAAAAGAALAEGAGLMLGPLTSGETAAVAPIARQANVAVLAFTNDPGQIQPGVWPLGITPGEQVRRLVTAVQAEGKSRIAAMLPDSDFGRVMANSLTQAATVRGLPPPNIRQYASNMASINQTARDLSDFANRRGPIDARIRAARAENTPDGRRKAQDLAKEAIPPPPFDALLLGDTGESLAEIAAVLPYYDLDASLVHILGPALWANAGSRGGQIVGAWYAAPDPGARAPLVQAYAAKYGAPPPGLADLAFDAAAIARVLAGHGYSVGALTQPNGFSGVDGWLALEPDGEVRRGLAVFQIQRGGGVRMLAPAPESPTAPGA